MSEVCVGGRGKGRRLWVEVKDSLKTQTKGNLAGVRRVLVAGPRHSIVVT